jgi:hypothetical protein
MEQRVGAGVWACVVADGVTMASGAGPRELCGPGVWCVGRRRQAATWILG